MKIVKKLWGHEEIIVNTDLYCFKYLHLIKGFQCSLHSHKKKEETFILKEGIVEIEYIGKIYHLNEGHTVTIKPHQLHRFKSITDTAILIEVSTHDDPEDSYRIEKSKAVE